MMPSSPFQLSSLKQWVLAWLVAGILGMQMSAVSPALHSWVHHGHASAADEKHEHQEKPATGFEHACSLTILAQGQEAWIDSATTSRIFLPLVSLPLTGSSPHGGSPRKHQQARAPPGFA